MTTLKDYLNDLVVEAIKKKEEHEMAEEELMTWEEAKEDLLDEYIDIIKERIIG